MIVLPKNGTSPLIIGHRGNPGNPLNTLNIENTVPSFQSALGIGTNGCELDFEMSLDSVLFNHHDDTFGRVFISPDGNNTKLVSSYRWADIQKAGLNIGGLEKSLKEKLGYPISLKHQESIRIPSADEIPELFDKSKILFVEVKVPKDKEPTSPEGKEYLKKLTKQVVQFIEKNDLLKQAYVLCFVGSVLEQVKAQNPQIHTVYNAYQDEVNTAKDTYANIEHRLKELQGLYGFEVIHPPFDQITAESVKICHDNGIEIGGWVWNEKPNEKPEEELEEAKRLANIGIDEICTNQPQQVFHLVG